MVPLWKIEGGGNAFWGLIDNLKYEMPLCHTAFKKKKKKPENLSDVLWVFNFRTLLCFENSCKNTA